MKENSKKENDKKENLLKESISKENEKICLIALSQIDGVGNKSIANLIEHYKTASNIFLDTETEILNILKTKSIRNKTTVFDKNKIIDKAKKIVEDSQKRKISIVSIFDTAYPFNLKQIENPPYILYTKGDTKYLRRNSVAIVGTRVPSDESKKYAFNLASHLSALNISVVSGMAKGVDTAAHYGALSALGNTVAVLGNGIDIVYPSENIKLFDKITERGIIVTEFPVGTQPERNNFPRRNRIISGLSYATIMVEAKSKSGALITVNYALEQGRDVFIAPYDEKKECYFGNHKLYKDGAKIIESVQDLILELDYLFMADNDYLKMKNMYFNETNVLNKENINNKSQKKYSTDSKDNTDNIVKTVNTHNTNNKDDNKESEEEYKKIVDTLKKEEKVIYDIVLKHKKIHIDDIASISNIALNEASAILMQLELKGNIHQIIGKYYKV